MIAKASGSSIGSPVIRAESGESPPSENVRQGYATDRVGRMRSDVAVPPCDTEGERASDRIARCVDHDSPGAMVISYWQV